MQLNKKSLYLLISSSLAISLGVIYFQIQGSLHSAVQETSQAGNAVITRVFVNEMWSEISPLLPEPGASVDSIKLNPNIQLIDSKIRRLISYTDVVKVKLYNVKGITIYSSETKQIGEDKSKNIGFLQAVRGTLASELTFRGQFGAFDGEIYGRNLVSTYAPIRDGYQIIAVAEIYSDRTHSINVVSNLLFKFLIILFLILLALFLCMIYIVKSSTQETAKFIHANEINSKLEKKKNSDLSKDHLSLIRFYFNELMSCLHRIDLSTTLVHNQKINLRSGFEKINEATNHALDTIRTHRTAEKLISNSYKPTIGLFSPIIFCDDIENYVTKKLKNLDCSVIFFRENFLKSSFIQDVNLIHDLLNLLLDLLCLSKFQGSIQFKFLALEDGIQVIILLNKKNKSSESDLNFHIQYYKNLLKNLDQNLHLKCEVDMAENLDIVTFHIFSYPEDVELLKIDDMKVIIGLTSDYEMDALTSILEKAGVKSNSIDRSDNLFDLVIKEKYNRIIIEDNLLDKNLELKKQLDLLVTNNHLESSKVFVINQNFELTHQYFGYQTIDIPFNSANLLYRLRKV